MASDISKADLISLCRLTAEIPDSISDAQIEQWLDLAVKRFTAFLYSVNPKWALSVDTITLDGSTERYDLPADFYKLAYAEYNGGSSDARRMFQVDITERSYYVDGEAVFDVAYYLVGDTKIGILPPSSSGAVDLYYRPAVTLGSTFAGRLGWEEWLCVYVGIQYHRRIAEPLDPWFGDLARIEGQIRREMAMMDTSQPGRVRNIEIGIPSGPVGPWFRRY